MKPMGHDFAHISAFKTFKTNAVKNNVSTKLRKSELIELLVDNLDIVKVTLRTLR